MATSIIIVNYNTKTLLDNCINSIYRTQLNCQFEIIVVDNNSSDNSIELKKKYPKIEWIANKENKGFGYANNQGVAVSKYEHILLLNSDTILEESIIDKLELACNNNNKCGGISPNILYEDKTIQNTYGNFPTVLFFWLNALKIIPILPSFIKEKLLIGQPVKFTEMKEVPHILGVAMFLKKAAFKTVNGFDTNFFLYFEETDLCDRMAQKGYRFYVMPNIHVIHLLSKSSPSSLFKTKHLNQSLFYYFRKRNIPHVSLYILSTIKLIILAIKNRDIRFIKLTKEIFKHDS